MSVLLPNILIITKHYSSYIMKNIKKPFFAKFLENQIADENLTKAKGGADTTTKDRIKIEDQTMKYPSDSDEDITLKYPSDRDEW